MADILETLKAAQGGRAVANLGARHKLSHDEIEQALTVLVPQLAKGFERNMLDRQGMGQLMDALASGGHARYATDASYQASAEALRDGEHILGHLLGSKTGSRQLAAYGQQETGIAAETLKRLLPDLATLFMGAVSQQGAQALGAIPGGLGGLEDILRRLPQAGAPGGGGGIDITDILRRLPQGGGGGAGQGGSGGGFGDIFGEIMRRLPQGGGAQGGPSGGGGYGIPPLPGGGAPQSQGGGGGFQIPGFPEVQDVSAGPSGGAGGQPRGGSPLPLPQSGGPSGGGWSGNNPYGDIGDIIRGGGQGGGILATIIRSIFGSIIGRSAAPATRGGGWLGWIIKLILMRYGWRIVTGIFRGILRR